MTYGKTICSHLKAIRQRIAEENDISLEVEECTYMGECSGTCPHCEAEVRYLENTLADRLRLGKVATVAGLALGLAATTAQAQSVSDTTAAQLWDTVNRCDEERLAPLPALMPNDAPEMVTVRKLGQGRPLAGVLTAEIQVILGGTPASIGHAEPGNLLYEEKKEDNMRIVVQ